jgi:Family of unknown function (DUF6134)
MPRPFAHAIAAVLLALPGVAAARQWIFDVTADGLPIGTYRVEVTEDGATTRHATADARYRVRLLVIDAYSYEQHDEQTWQGDCLVRLEARTVEHGKTITVSAREQGDAFVVDGPHGREALPRCPMSFAWWNPGVVHAKALVNTQTGALTPVSVTALGQDRITVRGAPIDALRYQVETERTVTDVWYAGGSEWVALRSTTKVGGHVLTYRLK